VRLENDQGGRLFAALGGFALAGLLSVLATTQLLADSGPCTMHAEDPVPCSGECPANYPNCEGAVTLIGTFDENGVFHPVTMEGECFCFNSQGGSTLPATLCQLIWRAPCSDPETRTYSCKKNLCPEDCGEPHH